MQQLLLFHRIAACWIWKFKYVKLFKNFVYYPSAPNLVHHVSEQWYYRTVIFNYLLWIFINIKISYEYFLVKKLCLLTTWNRYFNQGNFNKNRSFIIPQFFLISFRFKDVICFSNCYAIFYKIENFS